MHLWSTYVPVTPMVHHLVVPTPYLFYDLNGSTPMVPLVYSPWFLWSPSLWSLRSPFNGQFCLTPCQSPLPRPPTSSTPWSPMLFYLLSWLPVTTPGLILPVALAAPRGPLHPWSPVGSSLSSPALPDVLAAPNAFWHILISHGLPSVVSRLAGCPCRAWRSLTCCVLPWSPVALHGLQTCQLPLQNRRSMHTMVSCGFHPRDPAPCPLPLTQPVVSGTLCSKLQRKIQHLLFALFVWDFTGLFVCSPSGIA